MPFLIAKTPRQFGLLPIATTSIGISGFISQGDDSKDAKVRCTLLGAIKFGSTELAAIFNLMLAGVANEKKD